MRGGASGGTVVVDEANIVTVDIDQGGKDELTVTVPSPTSPSGSDRLTLIAAQYGKNGDPVQSVTYNGKDAVLVSDGSTNA